MSPKDFETLSDRSFSLRVRENGIFYTHKLELSEYACDDLPLQFKRWMDPPGTFHESPHSFTVTVAPAIQAMAD